MNAPIAANSTLIEERLTPEKNQTPTPVFRHLTGRDRCDSCPAAAKAEFEFISGPIHLCGHHTRVSIDRLLEGSLEAWIEPEELWEDNQQTIRAQMEALAAVHRPTDSKPARMSSAFS